jgi:hypothetical protein
MAEEKRVGEVQASVEEEETPVFENTASCI